MPNKRVGVQEWVNSNADRVLDFVRVMYPDGCTMTNIRGFMRGLNQTGNIEGFLRNLVKRDLVRWDKKTGLVVLTAKARAQEKSAMG